MDTGFGPGTAPCNRHSRYVFGQALRGFLDRIENPPGDGLLQVVRNLGAMLDAAQGRTHSDMKSVGHGGCGGGI